MTAKCPSRPACPPGRSWTACACDRRIGDSPRAPRSSEQWGVAAPFSLKRFPPQAQPRGLASAASRALPGPAVVPLGLARLRGRRRIERTEQQPACDKAADVRPPGDARAQLEGRDELACSLNQLHEEPDAGEGY